MTGRITRLVDDQQLGTIAAADGLDYIFKSGSLLGVTFDRLHVGAPVTFIPTEDKKRATAVRIDIPKTPRP